jgi:hypothetical protein
VTRQKKKDLICLFDGELSGDPMPENVVLLLEGLGGEEALKAPVLLEPWNPLSVGSHFREEARRVLRTQRRLDLINGFGLDWRAARRNLRNDTLLLEYASGEKLR